MRWHIVGQAPSRQGDGRPFTGPSGARLCRLLNLSNYEALSKRYDLVNLVNQPAMKLARGDTFDREGAETRAKKLMIHWAKDPDAHVVIACGHEVFKALTGTRVEFFKGKTSRLTPTQKVETWCFPHPSGASSYWNSRENVLEAQKFLINLHRHYGRRSAQ